GADNNIPSISSVHATLPYAGSRSRENGAPDTAKFLKRKEHKACQKNYFDISCSIFSIILSNILAGSPARTPKPTIFNIYV
ncbi:MAG: hypothetical protein LBB66_00565, partial [Desulfovibrio sp.]|nr:hypothetical protein [Desulfovibrio sp.]